MGSVIVLFGALGAAILWCFFSFQPQYVDKKQLNAFNYTALALCAILCAVSAVYLYAGMSIVTREKYYVLAAIGLALAIETVVLGLCLLARNFWLFRRSKNTYI